MEEPSQSESKTSDSHLLASENLRFTSIHSINRKMGGSDEDVLKTAQSMIATITKQAGDVLSLAFTYEFDIFEFSKHTKRPLLVLGVYLLSNSPIFSTLFETKQVDMELCARFLDLCEKLYQDNPYHNHIHAADVTQFNLILLSSSFIQKHFEPCECLAGFMSAVAHDIGHIGKNNDFLIKSKHELALKFKNVSCLENYHIEQFHETIAENSRANWIKHFDGKTQQKIIDIVEFAIIGTDMGVYHGGIKQAVKEKYNAEFVAGLDSTQMTLRDKQFLIRAMLHLSDISNPMRLFDVARKWATRVNQEFFNQGDLMKKLKLEVSAGCDRTKTGIAKNQAGFVDFCVKPLADSMCVLIGELKWCLDNIEVSREKWKQVQKAMEASDKAAAESAATEAKGGQSSDSANDTSRHAQCTVL